MTQWPVPSYTQETRQQANPTEPLVGAKDCSECMPRLLDFKPKYKAAILSPLPPLQNRLSKLEIAVRVRPPLVKSKKTAGNPHKNRSKQATAHPSQNPSSALEIAVSCKVADCCRLLYTPLMQAAAYHPISPRKPCRPD